MIRNTDLSPVFRSDDATRAAVSSEHSSPPVSDRCNWTTRIYHLICLSTGSGGTHLILSNVIQDRLNRKGNVMSNWRTPITRKNLLAYLMGREGMFSSESIVAVFEPNPKEKHYNRAESVLHTLTRRGQVARVTDGSGKRFYKFRSQTPIDSRDHRI